MFYNLSDQNSIANRFLLELRHQSIQNDKMRFRKNLERLGEILAYEISKSLSYQEENVPTSLGTARVSTLQAQPVLLSILRAGIPFLQGFLNYFDNAETGFIGAYRMEGKDKLEIKMEYIATPSVSGKEVIIIDPMLATGGSLISAIRSVVEKGKPKRIYIASVIAAPEGISNVKAYLEKEVGISFGIWTGAVDQHLNELFYIVPGLGDAGDLSFGSKVD
jgi:uracil phosphoribosyltransferase